MGMFSLKGSDGGQKKPQGLASKEDIERYETVGYTHIVYEGTSHFVYVTDMTEREVFQKKIGLMDYEWFEEGTGNKTGCSIILFSSSRTETGRARKFLSSIRMITGAEDLRCL